MITHTDAIRYLRELSREISRHAEELTEQRHPAAEHFENKATDTNAQIDAVIALISDREERQRADFEALQPGPRHSDREIFNTP